MFFTRLRRGSKWVFIAVMFAFAFTFLFAGVGGGSGSGDIVQELLGMRGGSDPVKSAEKAVAKNPHNVGALIRLAQAYSAKKRQADAIHTYQKSLAIKPKDPSALVQLALLQKDVASVRFNRYAVLQSKLTNISGPAGNDALQSLTGTDTLISAYTSLLSTKVSTAYSSYVTAAKDWEGTEKSYAATIPPASTFQLAQTELELGQAASSAGDYPTAIKSYETFLRLTPKSPLAPQVKKALAELRKVSSGK